MVRGLNSIFESHDLQRALGLFTKISEREAQMTAELGAPGRPEVFHTAAPNYEPSVKYPLIELAATTLGSLIIPFGIAFLWEKLSPPDQFGRTT